MKPRLYIETTIPSYLVARQSRDLRLAADQQTTQEWWDLRRHEFDLFISEVVLEESGKGDASFVAKRMALLARIPRLSTTTEADALASYLVDERIIPPVAAPDAVHLALATTHRMDFLLTWNCKHIHNPHLERRIEAACRKFNLVSPVICTPAELMGDLGYEQE